MSLAEDLEGRGWRVEHLCLLRGFELVTLSMTEPRSLRSPRAKPKVDVRKILGGIHSQSEDEGNERWIPRCDGKQNRRWKERIERKDVKMVRSINPLIGIYQSTCAICLKFKSERVFFLLFFAVRKCLIHQLFMGDSNPKVKLWNSIAPDRTRFIHQELS